MLNNNNNKKDKLLHVIFKRKIVISFVLHVHPHTPIPIHHPRKCIKVGCEHNNRMFLAPFLTLYGNSHRSFLQTK